ncbi:histone-lysine N-methyltransferase family member SUVH9 isoform X2 [Hevea brasiliensis]|uniref:histone-lysine N-methyltransferase family member SUVH9 isoform X2 n=1 Tax=Hevea brasiliensis TaxID=3981 RepID=UPI0025E58138|nr:histone-lysine N-methyltransferase family member SUVH9 isoform X2 [Hevea brasiliensis]
MGSTVPFQDLNLSPSPSSSPLSTNAAVPTPPPLLIPKIEPKLEPLDDLVETPQPQEPQDPLYPDFTPNLFSNSEHTPPSQSSALSSSQEDNVYSEYHRISELFRTAFAKRLQQQYGDVSVLDPDSRAIVPVNEDSSLSSVVVTRPPRRYPKRSSELVRVTDLGIEDQRYFRDVCRRTRMLYDALRIFSVLEEEKRRGESLGRRARGDLLAASLMRERGLWLNRDKRIVGSIPGVEVGDLFFFRMELCVVGLHGQVQAGIDYLPASQSSNREPIATSIIVSGGYEDDEDSGDMLIYTGHGGQDKFSRQCMHQKLEGGNLALERSMHYGIEVVNVQWFCHSFLTHYPEVSGLCHFTLITDAANLNIISEYFSSFDLEVLKAPRWFRIYFFSLVGGQAGVKNLEMKILTANIWMLLL